MKSLREGEWYTRQEIREACGGEIQSYLPQYSGEIVCGCFTKNFNPDAPGEIQVGKPPKVVKKARILAEQSSAIPVFLKEKKRIGKMKEIWEYCGLYVFDGLIQDEELLRKAEEKSGRHGKLEALLRLKKVS